MNAAQTTLRPYYVCAAGLEFIHYATSAGMAIMDAMELHGVRAASAKPAGQQP